MNQNQSGNVPVSNNPNVPNYYGGQGGMPQNPQNYPMQTQGNPQFYGPRPTMGPQGNPQQYGQQPNLPLKGQQPGKGKKSNQKKNKNGSAVGWIFLGILLMLVLVFGGAYLGYQSAIRTRMAEYNRQSSQAAIEQYEMAVSDIEAGKYENAKNRLEYVLQVNPDYPGATEMYTDVVGYLYPKETPTPYYTATPAPTSTPDTRGEEDMYNAVLASMVSQDWTGALAQMDSLRDKNLEYRAMEMDGLYYIALRYEGINLINQGYLESGIYKISLSSSFGPIDAIANSMRDAGRSYLSGAGFWEIDWNKALSYYANAYASYPNIYDRATMLTATERYAEASFEVANLYVISEDYCGAIPYYDQGFLVGSDAVYSVTATAAYNTCHPSENVVATADPATRTTGEATAEVFDPGTFYDASAQ